MVPITAPKDKEIIGEVNKVTDYAMVKTMDKAVAIETGLYDQLEKKLMMHMLKH